MGKVIFNMTMSLDGFVAGPHDGPANPLGDGGSHLFTWYSRGDTTYKMPGGHWEFNISAASAVQLDRAIKTVGVMDPNNPVIKLCVAGSRAEFEGRLADAQTLYRQAWDAAQDDYEACIAAHYVARHQTTPAETLRWNQIALAHADAVADERVQGFYGSLYLNVGHSYEMVGDQAAGQRYYALAAALGFVHQAD